MSLRINLNVAAMTAHRTLSATDTNLSKTIERLSSGFKINSAGDDPAGLVISEKLRAQVSGLDKAISNAGDAVNMVKTAEGALSEVSRILRSMRDLAVHASNTGANDNAAVQADQAQINNSIQSLNKIAQETMFGGRKLLDGSAGVRAFIDGTAVMTGDFSYASNLTDGSAIKVKVTQAAEKARISSGATYASLYAASTSSTATFAGVTSLFAADGTLTLAGGATITYNSATTTAANFIASVNAVKATTGVIASFDANTQKIVLTSSVKGTAGNFFATVASTGAAQFTQGQASGQDWGVFATRNGSMYINGVKIDYSSGNTVNEVLTAINSKTDLTGVTATYNDATNLIDLQSQEYGSTAKINVTEAADFLGNNQTAANDIGQNIVAQVTKVFNGVEDNVSDAVWQSGSGLEIKDSMGNTIKMREAEGSVAADYSTQFNLGVNTLRFQVGAYDHQIRDVNIGTVFANELGRGAVEDGNVATMDVTTYQGAQNAIKIMDDAIKQISTQRAALGATQSNVLESSINSLNIAKENISASESTIRDTDMAAEVVNLTRNQILQQSGVSMLAQANSMPQTLLKLLQ